MTIYRLEVTIDGYGGVLEDRYFFKFANAEEALAKTSGIFHAPDGSWHVDGMKECRTWEEEYTFQLRGIPFPENERDEWSILYCTASITPVDINFELTGDLYLLKLFRGYKHYVNNVGQYSDFSEYQANNQPFVLGYFQSEKKARKKAARDRRFKKIGRLWVNPEFEKKCDILGDGQDYLSIKRVVVQ